MGGGLGPLATPSPMATTPYGMVSSPLGAPQSRMPPAPPPPTSSAGGSGLAPPPPPLIPSMNNNGGLDGDLHGHLGPGMAKFPHTHLHHHQHQSQMQMQMQPVLNEAPGTPQGIMYPEQEPLLNRSFISPTCPRHGKQAAQAAQAAMAAMEEIQV